jgi:penicillin V acylase-like amidase (Ntn superfamily)
VVCGKPRKEWDKKNRRDACSRACKEIEWRRFCLKDQNEVAEAQLKVEEDKLVREARARLSTLHYAIADVRELRQLLRALVK